MRAVGRPSTEKIVVFSLLGAGVFVVGLLLLINSVTESSREKALATVNAEAKRIEDSGPSVLNKAAAVAAPFVAHVGAGRFAEAHALLAAPYRNAVTVEAFAKACRASPILAGARSVTLNRLRQQSAGTAATIEASGVLDSGAGAVPIGFVMLQEAAGLRILVVSLANVPVLQGVAPR